MIYAILIIFIPGSLSEDTVAWKVAGYIVLALLIIIVSYFLCRSRKNNTQMAELNLLHAIKKMRMDEYQLRDKIIEILKNEKVPYREDPDFETSLSIYIGENKQLISLKYLFTRCTDEEVAEKFLQFLNKNNQFK